MSSGYSCFVAPHGSLFHVQPGRVRLYPSVSKVIEQYHSESRTPQRSVARIHRMGFGGGLAAPLVVSSRLQGFLFLNWRELEDFPVSASDNYLVSILLCGARIAFFEEPLLSSKYFFTSDEDDSRYIGAVFEPDLLTEEIKIHLRRLGGGEPDVRVTSSLPHTLVSHGNLAQIIARLILAGTPSEGTFTVSLSLNGDMNVVFLEGGTWIDTPSDLPRLGELLTDAHCLGFEVDMSPDRCMIRFSHDGPFYDGYSVEYPDWKPT